LYKVPRKALLYCPTMQCRLYNSASGGIYSICPEDRWHASGGHPMWNGAGVHTRPVESNTVVATNIKFNAS